MRDILAEIVEKKKEIVRDAKKQLPIGEIMENISYASFEGSHSLKKHGWSLIAECKLQSPAKGRLTRSHSVLELAMRKTVRRCSLCIRIRIFSAKTKILSRCGNR